MSANNVLQNSIPLDPPERAPATLQVDTPFGPAPVDGQVLLANVTRFGRLLRRAGLPVPPVLVCAEDVARGKPSPDAYLLAARELGVLPSACLVVEDAPAGIQAARAAGMPVVGVTTTHPGDQLPADACAESLAGVYLGRVDRDPLGRARLEILVVEP